ncbi:MAG: Lrp/AsnC family transcriptional regulator [Anaerolineales bacterium]|jgi:DNA-binding Lrp family transcriptional regulator
MTYTLDSKDSTLLEHIQSNARLTSAELGKLVNLSPSGVQKRLRKLEENGIVERYATMLNRKRLGYHLLVFVKVIIQGHTAELIAEFDDAIREMQEVLESHRIIGDADYLLKVVVRDREQLDHFLMKQLLSLDSVARVSSYLVLKEVKETTSIGLNDHK